MRTKCAYCALRIQPDERFVRLGRLRAHEACQREHEEGGVYLRADGTMIVHGYAIGIADTERIVLMAMAYTQDIYDRIA